MDQRRLIYLQAGGGTGKKNCAGGEFDPRTHKLYPFKSFTNFNSTISLWKNGWGAGKVKLPSLVCNYCNEPFEDEANFGGYYTARIIFYSRWDVRLACTSCAQQHRLNKLPSHYDQQYGYSAPVEFPKKFENSIDHIIAWKFAGNKYQLNGYLGRPFTEKESKETRPVFGEAGGGSSPVWHHYSKNDVVIDGPPKRKLNRKKIAELIDEILFEVWQQRTKPAEIDYTKEPMHTVFLHATEGKLPARKEFFERCYRQIQEAVAQRPSITINRRMVTMIMEDTCLTDDKDFKDLQRLCEQAAEQWHERFAARLNNSQMQLFFTI